MRKRGSGVSLRKVMLAGLTTAAFIIPVAVLGQTGALNLLSSPANRPWPAPVHPDGQGQVAALSPQDALKTFHMPPGYRLELVAAEPLVQNPILMEFDGDGRLWVLEMQGFAINDAMDNSFEPINNLVILEDTNQDGVFDKRTVFMDKLVMPRAFKILDKNCALVGEPPNLWKACDTNGDLKFDTKELLDKSFSTLGVVEHGANGLFWGMDNRIYVAEHTYDLEFKSGKFEVVPGLNRGQWGVTQDDGGRIYRNVNTDPLFVDYVSPRYFARNPDLVRTAGLYESLVRQEDTKLWPVRPTLGLNRGYRTDIFRPDGTASYYGGVSSPLIYRGDRLPKELNGQAFVVDGPTNLVHLLKLEDDGAGRLKATDFYPRGELLASTDERFRPVAMTTGWDGALYITDMYRGVSQDGPLQTDYLKDYIGKKGLAKDINRGRIYRIVKDGMVLDKKPSMSGETSAQLVEHLSHPSGWWRDTAQQLLIQRADRSVVPALKRQVLKAPDWRTRIQALWTLNGLDAMDAKLVTAALDDARPDVRAAAVRMAEPYIGKPGPVRAALLRKIDDPSWFVRRQLAASLGELPKDAKLEPIVAMLQRYGDDPVTVDAAISGLSDQEGAALAGLLRTGNPSRDAIAMLAGAASKSRDPAQVQSLLALASDGARAEPIRIALMEGMSMGLQGGDGRGGAGNAVVGGRAGSAVPGAMGRRSSAKEMEIAAVPTSLIALAASSGSAAEAAQQLTAGLRWPGKPQAPAATPLTPDEQRLFAAGKEIYDGTCVACHSPDGRGVERVGAPLAGSAHVNAAGDATTRILLSGKEGKMGLMPPLGAGMSDEELASLLTYVRRAWGNTGAPVVPAAVKETRQAYAHRDTPWTDEDLAIRRR